MRATVNIPDNVLRRAKAEATLRGMPLDVFISDLLERETATRLATERKHRVKLPLVRGNGRRIINPTREELDAGLWD